MKLVIVLFTVLVAVGSVSAVDYQEKPYTNQPYTNQSPTDSRVVSIELNQVRQKENNCISYFLLKNKTAYDFDSFKIELVTFDKGGLINNRILGDFKKIRAGKTIVKLLPIPDIKCEKINKVLINDVHDCSTTKEDKLDCLELLSPSNLSNIKLFK